VYGIPDGTHELLGLPSSQGNVFETVVRRPFKVSLFLRVVPLSYDTMFYIGNNCLKLHETCTLKKEAADKHTIQLPP
jgi:hypothetical protein